MDGPITERSNPKSLEIDVASPEVIVKTLASCDDEIFQGYEGSGGIYNESILSKMEIFSSVISEMFTSSEEGVIIISGAGTSGRLAFLVVSNFNEKLISLGKRPCFNYLIAGTDEALFTSDGANEDDPHQGEEDLKFITKNKQKVIYVGITCGLSTPYIGGQLEYALGNLNGSIASAVLVGFNPVCKARNNPVEKWDKTFRDVAMRMEELEKCQKAFIINPIIGPEPITGSSRMKGGSATKILLEGIFTLAIMKAFGEEIGVTPLPSLKNLLKAYEIVKNCTYASSKDIAKTIQKTGFSLLQGGHLNYISSLKHGVVGLIDASECPSTFGATLNDVRGFIRGGYEKLQNKDGCLDSYLDISTEYFIKERLPCLPSNDLIIVLQACAEEISLSNNELFYVIIRDSVNGSMDELDLQASSNKALNIINIDLAEEQLNRLFCKAILEFTKPFYVEMSLKWVCNCISTGAHVLKGKVYQNYMIDVKITKDKLYHRALSIVQKFGEVSLEEAQENILKCIYETDEFSMEQKNAENSCHIKVASCKVGIVPTAIVISRKMCSYREAVCVIHTYPTVREALLN